MSLREMFEETERDIKNYDFSAAVNDLRNIGYDYGQDDLVNDFVDEDYINDMVTNELNSGGWTRVACFLAKVDNINEDYYRVNGYGNLEEVTKSDLECTLSDLKKNLCNELEEEEDEEEIE